MQEENTHGRKMEEEQSDSTELELHSQLSEKRKLHYLSEKEAMYFLTSDLVLSQIPFMKDLYFLVTFLSFVRIP